MALIKKIRNLGFITLSSSRSFSLRKIYHMDISKSTKISFWAIIDKSYPKGIHIDDESIIASGAMILTHDFCHGTYKHTTIGKKCFIGARSIILPGITIGDEVIVGAGSVVTKDVQPHCIVTGNPAKIIKEDIKTKRYGQIMK
jgi:acetyltransferase-like isoleucine patch superfamily enzyme